MAPEGPSIRFRPVQRDDLEMLGDWLARPHCRKWWGEPEIELGYIRDMLDGRDTTRPYIFQLDGADAGYIQVWFVGDHLDPEWVAKESWLAELPEGSVGVDISIGDADQLSKGLGSAALTAFVERLRAEGHSRIIIDPDPANLRAVRAYQKAGFRPMPEFEGRTKGMLLMVHHRDGDGEGEARS